MIFNTIGNENVEDRSIFTNVRPSALSFYPTRLHGFNVFSLLTNTPSNPNVSKRISKDCLEIQKVHSPETKTTQSIQTQLNNNN